MRLLERQSNGGFCLTKNIPDDDIFKYPYAILSHRWGPDDEEVKFEDVESGFGQHKPGYKKLEFCGEQAQKDNLKYFWVDSCCIKKSSDSELSESINSMYRWYSRAAICYVYLSDVSTTKGQSGDRNAQDTWELSFKASSWFSRGWTLQELLAPESVEFYSQDHQRLGDKMSLSREIHEVTGIAVSALQGTSLSQFSVDERFKWADSRRTTRQEDLAYCLLGIFEVSMSVIYGEGREKAIHRLKKEIKEASNYMDAEPVLEDLRKRLPTAKDAPFNSFAKQHEPTCLASTRIDLLQSIYDWANGSDGRYIFWLNGWAGTGKSTIARTVARRWTEQRTLGASFFFARGGGDVENANKFVTSIAMQLASNVRALRRHISDALSEHNDITSLALRDQWQRLVLGPLSKLEGDVHRAPYVLVVDALDECDNERDINTVLQIVTDSQASKGAKLRVFLTSRPETPIRYCFSRISESEHKAIILHNISKSIVYDDITLFLQNKLTDIAQERSFKSGWPGREKLGSMVQIAGGLFIWAATACKFIREGQRFAEQRLDKILSCSRSAVTAPEQHLDAIYITVLEHSISSEYEEEEKNEACRMLREVLGSMAVLFSPLSVSSLSRLLSMPEEDISQTLGDLHSVIDVPKDNKRLLRLHHASLRDFLLSKDRCKSPDFWVDESHIHQILFTRCLELMSSSLKQDICGVHQPGKLATSLDTSEVEQHLPSGVQYACTYWVQHLQKSSMPLCDDDQVAHFLRKHFLHWLEALGWMRQTHEGVLSVINLESIALAHDCPNLSALIYDMKRFCVFSRPVIEQAPLQVYISLQIFAPKRSLIRKQFVETMANWIVVPSTVAEERNVVEVTDFVACQIQDFFDTRETVRSNALPHTHRAQRNSGNINRNLPERLSERSNDLAISTVSLEGAQQLASYSLKQTARLHLPPVPPVDEQWDACLSTLHGHTSSVRAVTLSPNDELLASASSDSTVRLWNARTGMLRYTLQGHKWGVTTLDFSPNGQLVASGSWDYHICIWNVATGDMRYHLRGHVDWVKRVLFIAQGQYLASASADKTIRIWDISTGELNQVLEGHGGPVNTLASKSQLLASGSDDTTIRLWNIRLGKFLHSFEGHTDTVLSISFSPDGELLCSASYDGTVRLWNINRREQYRVCKGHTDPIWDVKFSPNGRLVASCSDDCSVRLWDVRDHKEHGIHRRHSNCVRTLFFSPEGDYLLSGSNDGTICHWNLKSEDVCCSFDSYGDPVGTLTMLRDGQIMASASMMSGTIRLWDMQLHGTSTPKRRHEDVEKFLLSPDGEVVASESWSGTIRIWNVKTATCLQTPRQLDHDTRLKAFSPDSRHLLLTSGTSDKAAGNHLVWCYRIESCRLYLLKGHTNEVESLTFSPDGRLLASCSADQTTRVWNLERQQHLAMYENATIDNLRELPRERSLWRDVSHWGKTPTFSADGQFLATTLKTGKLVLWDTKTGEYYHTTEAYKGLSWYSPPRPLLSSRSEGGRSVYDSLLSFQRWNQWLSYAGVEIIQIPPHYRADLWAAHGNTIVLSGESGRMMFLSFRTDVE